VTPGQPLPFADRSFDIVFSNAVVEHAGGTQAQQRFVGEVCRVGRAFFITTPNRWFPFEHHTGLPLIHCLPPRVFRRVIARTRYRYWADEAHLSMLDARSFPRLFPPGSTPALHRIRLGPFTSNLAALGWTKRETS
jgi:SAM-dependent methyltransferase